MCVGVYVYIYTIVNTKSYHRFGLLDIIDYGYEIVF